jgi:DNA-binding NarL/FixJ family response regulator
MRLALEPDLEIAGEAGDGLEALSMAQALDPSVVVMNIEMPQMDGITATGRLRELAPRVAVVIHSLHDDAVTRERALRAGADAFSEKCGAVEALLTAIRQAALSERNPEPPSGVPERKDLR